MNAICEVLVTTQPNMCIGNVFDEQYDCALISEQLRFLWDISWKKKLKTDNFTNCQLKGITSCTGIIKKKTEN